MLDHFFENTSLHGFKYLIDGEKPMWKKSLSRLFWTTFIIFSIYFMFIILSGSLKEYGSKTTSINLDTNYRNWNNTFPAISICMIKGRSTQKIQDFMTNYWQINNISMEKISPRIYRSIQSLLFIDYQQPLDGISIGNCDDFNSTCGVDIEILKKTLLPQNCSDFMTSFKFLEREMNCWNFFKIQRTEIGDCFTANSLYNENKLMTYHQLPLKFSNLEPDARTIEIEYSS
jgi:hypothetical protein